MDGQKIVICHFIINIYHNYYLLVYDQKLVEHEALSLEARRERSLAPWPLWVWPLRGCGLVGLASM